MTAVKPLGLAACLAALLLTGAATGSPAAQSLRERLAERRTERQAERQAEHRGGWQAGERPAEGLAARWAERRGERPTETGLDEGADRRAAVTLPAGASVRRDVAYGPSPAQRMDVYTPARAAGAPVVVMVHGGGWKRGDKAMDRVVSHKVERWLPQGYILVSINYRMLPEATPLAQANDVARALAAVQTSAASWGGDPGRVLLMGHSAGAHLVTLLTAAPEIAAHQGARAWLGTVALDSAAFDVTQIMSGRHFSLYDEAFGADAALWRDASPSLRLHEAIRPLLAVCSSRRAESCAQAQGFAARAAALGGRVTVLPEPLSHGEINGTLGQPSAYTEAVEDFLRSLGLP